MYYYIEKDKNKLAGKLESEEHLILDSFIEVSERQYNTIKLPFIIENNNFEIQNIMDLQMQELLISEKEKLIKQSKEMLVEYLKNNPLHFADGKYYSVTQEKQNLLNNAITVYQMKTQLGLPAELKWNSTGEECSVWTLEDAISLALGIASYVEPLVTYQQSIEVQIRNCTTKEELESTVIDYETV